MKRIVRAMIMITVSAATAAYAQKASSLPQNLQQHQPPEQQNANQPTMTHVDPGQFTTESTKDVPQIDPGKIPSPGKHAGPSAVPQPPPAPAGPEVTGFQTPDHLLDDVQGGRLPGDQGRYEQSVRDLFDDADAISDLPGMAGSEVDPRGQLGGQKETPFDQLGGSGTGLDEANFMPTPTTPRTSPQNTRGGPDRAPLTPGGPRDAMSGAAGYDMVKRSMSFGPDGEVTHTTERGDSRDGSTHTHARTEMTTGHVIHYDSYRDEEGRGQWSLVVYDSNGQETDRDSGSHNTYYEDELDVAAAGTDITRDPYEVGGGNAALTMWHYQNLHHGRKGGGLQDPNRGPPPGGEEGAAGAPPGTDFDLGDDIVINPDPAQANGAGGGQLPRAVDQRSQIEQDHTPGGYTPEDSGR